MNVDKLIALLQDLKQKHESYPGWEEQIGPLEIVMDVFQWRSAGSQSGYVYAGFSPNIKVSFSSDWVYPILMAEETFQDYDDKTKS